MSIIIGLTGPTGAGKSSLTATAEAMGFKVIDCDKTARAATKKGTPGLAALSEVFGSGILERDGELNRKELAVRAFSSRENTQLLNKTVLPFITGLIKSEIDSDRVILDAPTLFESGVDSICDVTIAVLAQKDLRLSRIINRDSMDLASANLRIGAGQPDEFYKKRADYIIYNNSDSETYTSRFSEILNKILEEKQ